MKLDKRLLTHADLFAAIFLINVGIVSIAFEVHSVFGTMLLTWGFIEYVIWTRVIRRTKHDEATSDSVGHGGAKDTV